MIVLQGPAREEHPAGPGWVRIISRGPGKLRLESAQPLTWWERQFSTFDYYLVFTAPHPIELRFPLQSAQATFVFEATFKATAQIVDPIAAVRLGIRDSAEYIRRDVEFALEQATCCHDFRQLRAAQTDAAAALQKLQRNPNVRLSQLSVLLEADDTAKRALQTIEGGPLEIDVAKVTGEIRNAELEDWARSLGSLETILARMMVCSDEELKKLKEVIALKMRRETEFTEHQLALFKIVVESGRYEELDMPAGFKAMLDKLDTTFLGPTAVSNLLTQEDKEKEPEANVPSPAPDPEE